MCGLADPSGSAERGARMYHTRRVSVVVVSTVALVAVFLVLPQVANGGTGIGDMASFFGAPGPMTVDLTAGNATGDGSDTLSGVEDIDGSRFDDVITGSAGSNFLFGETGNDTLSGSDGNN